VNVTFRRLLVHFGIRLNIKSLILVFHPSAGHLQLLQRGGANRLQWEHAKSRHHYQLYTSQYAEDAEDSQGHGVLCQSGELS